MCAPSRTNALSYSTRHHILGRVDCTASWTPAIVSPLCPSLKVENMSNQEVCPYNWPVALTESYPPGPTPLEDPKKSKMISFRKICIVI